MPVTAQATPWDGEWEGTIKHSDLPCSPCRVRVTVSNGQPTVRGSTAIPSFSINPYGEVAAEVPVQVAGNAVRANCRLSGRAYSATITALGTCGNYSTTAELELRRVSAAPAQNPSVGPSVAAAPAGPPPPAAVPAAPSTPAPASNASFGANAQPVRLGEMSYAMDIGAEIGQMQLSSWATSCGSGRNTALKLTPAMRPNPATTRAQFDAVMREFGYPVGAAPDATSGAPANYLVIGRVTGMRMIHCIRENTNPLQSSGSGAMTVDWHVVAATSGATVYRTTTSGSFDLPAGERTSDGVTQIFAGTYRDMMRRLAADGGFRNALMVPAAVASSSAAGSGITIRALPRNTGGITANMDKIMTGVVEVRRSSGGGTGFVVDSRGYLLTNAHVVGTSDTVTVRFNDGQSSTATVVRRDTLRDIALLKVERTGLRALPIRTGRLTLTEKVFAIGNPLGLSQTVTDGIVSAYRQSPNNGQEYIQASVAVTFGNSGGPLLDANGNVVGVSVSGIGGGMLGLNFFIPIESALQRLDLRLGN